MTDGDDALLRERTRSLFAGALELQGEARSAYLDRAAQGDPGLRREVESLLAAHDRAGSLPEQFGRYRIRSLLGEGGMGEVYLAHDPRLERDVALKVLPADLAEHPQRRAHFLQEARAAASLNHPNITTIHEIGEADGRDYIAFEYVQGKTLRELVAGKVLGLFELIDIAVPLADALGYAHERGIVHRDVKSTNVMVTERGLPKLLDFGLAKLVASGSTQTGDSLSGVTKRTHTLSGSITGTPGAMSPEQALGKPTDQRSDVFSFGSLLHEMASGRDAFAGNSAAETIAAVIHRNPQPLQTLRPDLPPEFGRIIGKALRKVPAERYQSLAELIADLRLLRRASDTGLFAPGTAGAGDAQRRGAWRRALLASLAVITLVAAALAVVAALSGWWDRSPPATAASSSAPSPRRAAVMSFESTADPGDADQLGAMLTRLLTSHLSTEGGVEILSQQRLHDVARQIGRADGRIDRSVATEVALRAGVDTMILGQVGRVDRTLVATAEVVDVASGRTLASPTARGSGEADVFAMAEALGRQIRDTLREPALTEAEKRALAQQLTSSVDAFRAYVRGLQALQRNHPAEAAVSLQEATRIDPAFALAHFRLAMALVWTGRFEEIGPAIERASAFRERLPDDVRLLVDAASPYFVADDTRTALPVLLAVLERDRFNHDALYMLGEIYTHSATRNDSRKAADMYERLLELDRGFALVYEHLLSACLRDGRFDAARAHLDSWEPLAPDNFAELQGTLALWEGRLPEASALLREKLGPDVLLERDDSPAVREVLAASVQQLVESLRDTSGLYRVMALDLRADVLAYHGQFGRAAELYRLAADVPGAVSGDGFLTSARAGARQRLAFVLAQQGGLAGARREVDAALALQPDSFRCLALAAIFALRDHDEATAQRHLEVLADVSGRGWSPAASLYRDAVEAELDLAQGRAEQARDGFVALVNSGRLMEDWYAHEDSIGPLLRDGLARACLALGDADGAAEALDGLIRSGLERLRHPLPWVRALFSKGMLELQAGREVSGRDLLTRFLQHWGAADGDIQEVAQARAALAGQR